MFKRFSFFLLAAALVLGAVGFAFAEIPAGVKAKIDSATRTEVGYVLRFRYKIGKDAAWQKGGLSFSSGVTKGQALYAIKRYIKSRYEAATVDPPDFSAEIGTEYDVSAIQDPKAATQ